LWWKPATFVIFWKLTSHFFCVDPWFFLWWHASSKVD
jgi:hypothetical protein